jgi:hypothetical protein
MTISGQLSRPPPGSLVAVSGQFLVAAVNALLAAFEMWALRNDSSDGGTWAMHWEGRQRRHKQ